MNEYKLGTLNLVQGVIVPEGSQLITLLLRDLQDASAVNEALVFSSEVDELSVDTKRIHIESRKNMSLTSMLETCELRHHASTSLNVVLVDYDVLWGNHTLPSFDDIRLLKKAAKEMKVIITVLSESIPKDLDTTCFDNHCIIRVCFPDLPELSELGIDSKKIREIETRALKKLRGE